MRPVSRRLLVTAAVVLTLPVVAVLALGIGADDTSTPARHGSESAGSPTAGTATSPSAAETPPATAPMAQALSWTTRPFPEQDAVLNAIAEADGRLIVAGQLRVDGEPSVWYSDDGARTWTLALVNRRSQARPWPDPGEWPVRGLAVAGDHVVGLATTENLDPWETQLWVSADRGATWSLTRGPTAVIDNLVETASGFIAIGHDEPAPSARTYWTSSDGFAWERMNDPVPVHIPVRNMVEDAGVRVLAVRNRDHEEPDAVETPRVWTVVGGDGGELIALTDQPGSLYGVTRSPAGFIAYGYLGSAWQDHHAAMWRSSDGRVWTAVPIDGELGSVAYSVVSNAVGSVVIGTFESPELGMFGWNQFVWFSPGQTGPATTNAPEVPISGMVPWGDGFIGVGDCRSTDECGPAIIVGGPSTKQVTGN